MIRLAVTMLESFAYWKDREDATTEDLLRELAHVEPPTRNMMAGRAWARMWERSRPGEIDAATMDGWRFEFNLDAQIYVPPVRELKAEKIYETPSGPVTLVGKVDGLDGLTVRDQKLSERFEIEERYTDSIQWRSYLDMFDARKFIYDVFIGKYADDEDLVTITEYHQVPFYSYPNIRADVQKAVNELADIVSRYQPEIAALREAANQQKGAA